jgi:hypothetical protein
VNKEQKPPRAAEHVPAARGGAVMQGATLHVRN